MLEQKTVKIIQNIAQKYSRAVPSGTYDKSDLFQEGCIAALSADKSYNPVYGLKLYKWQVQKAIYAMKKYMSRYHLPLSGRIRIKDRPLFNSIHVSRKTKLYTDESCRDLPILIEDLLRFCTEEETTLIKLRFLEEKGLYEISKIIDKSMAYVSTKIKDTLAKIKNIYERNYLKNM